MNEELLQERSLDEAVFSIISNNETNLSSSQILKEWQEGREPEGLSVCDTYEGYSTDYLVDECLGMQRQFVRFAKEILEEASK